MAALSNEIFTLITDNHYFPCIAYCSALFDFSYIKIEQYENYPKTGFRNRCVVAGSNGLIHLSVPVQNGRDQKAVYKDVRVSYHENWPVQHWRTIASCYSKAPFFEYYAADLQALLEKKWDFLFDLNWHILQWLQKIWKLPASIEATETYHKAYPGSFDDQRNKWLPKNYAAHPTPHYYQLFEDRIGFQPNLSIIDLLFCEGPAAADLLKQPGAE